MSKMPTKSEAAAEIKIGSPHQSRAIIDRLEALGVEFSPERVAPRRGDALTENTELVDRMAVRDAGGVVLAYWKTRDRWVCAEYTGCVYTTENLLQDDVRPRIIDVPGEPEPELVAERRDDGNAYVGIEKWGSAYFPSEYYRQRANSYAAVARLREQEEREAGE